MWMYKKEIPVSKEEDEILANLLKYIYFAKPEITLREAFKLINEINLKHFEKYGRDVVSLGGIDADVFSDSEVEIIKEVLGEEE